MLVLKIRIALQEYGIEFDENKVSFNRNVAMLH